MKYIKYMGFSAIAAAWITIFAAISVNPWFRIQKNALSDLGGTNIISNFFQHQAPADPYIYNVGLMITGLLIALFAIASIANSRNSIENTGSAFFIIAALTRHIFREQLRFKFQDFGKFPDFLWYLCHYNFITNVSKVYL